MEKFSINYESIVNINPIISLTTEENEADETKEKFILKN